MTTLREAAQQALEAMEYDNPAGRTATITALRAALAEPGQEPVAWSHNLIDNIITHRPADIDRHPDRWTALYPDPKPCSTCEALARTVMMDQTGYDTAPPQRKPPHEFIGLELDEMDEIIDGNITITDSRLRDAVYAVVLDTVTTLMEKNTCQT